MLLVFVSAGILPQGSLANFEPVNGPGYDSPGFESVRGPEQDAEEFVCNETWVAWENTTEPHYLLFEVFDGRINYTFYDLQVLSGSEPFFYVVYFEEDENGERGRPVICQNPPGQIVVNSTDGLTLNDHVIFVTIYVVSSLSIIASIIMLLTYSLFKKLRTLPGLVVMNLALAFLLGDIILQIRIGHEYHDIIVLPSQALNQAFLLSRFAWMSLTGLEMCRSLYNGVKLKVKFSPCRKWGMLGIYMAIGWGIPAILTIIMATVADSSASETVKSLLGIVGYLVFHVPIGISLLINVGVVVFISVVFWNASRRQKRLESSSKKQKFNFLRLFLILLTALGLVWILFFVLQVWEGAKDILAIHLIYIIFTAIQPVFVCIAFVGTKKVYRMYLVLLHLRVEADLHRRTRQGTLNSMYSESELQRARTIISMNSRRDFNLTPNREDRPTLGTIEEGEEGEEEKNERPNIIELEEKENAAELNTTAVSNGMTNNGVTNGVLVSNGLDSALSNGSLNPDREETHV